MTELLTAAQMRAIEQAAIDSGEVTGLELMERAGHGVVEAVLEEWPEMANTPKWAAILCGPGNNGGDGYVIARLLKERGWYVETFYYGSPADLPPDALNEFTAFSQTQIAYPMTDRIGSAIFETECDLVVDAVFGTGLTRPLDDLLLDVLTDDLSLYLDVDMGAKCVSVDIPTGISADTGDVLSGPSGGGAFKAHLTVTFHAKKKGHQLSDGVSYCGKVVVKDIGLTK